MILRIVHMHFREEAIGAFLDLFDQHKQSIAGQSGCHRVHLIQSPEEPSRIGTVSLWESQAALDAYRSSALFAEVWPATKALFASKPTAESHDLRWSS